MLTGSASVIVPAYNAGRTLDRCLASLVALDDADYEIIVVDDGSSDDTAAICARYPVKYLRNAERVGPAISRNRGADQATGSILAFTDADCVVPADWMARVRQWLEVAPVICGTYRPAPWQNAIGRFANLDWYLYWFRFIPAETDSFSMGNVAFRREVYFDRVRLEEHFFRAVAAAEDTVLAMTIAERHRIVSTNQLWVLHMHRERVWPYFKKHVTTGFSRTLLSLAFPRRKVFGARDIRLSYVLPQLASAALLIAALLLLPTSWGPYGLVVAISLHTALQIGALIYLGREERSVGFLLMAWALIAIRNIAWLIGVFKALLYVLRSPPELKAAAKWRARPRDSTDIAEGDSTLPRTDSAPSTAASPPTTPMG